MLQQATKEKYGIETLKERNVSYDHEHGLTQKDVDMANNHVQLIERTRSEVTPQIGDRLVYVTEHGDYYGNALIDGKSTKEGYLSICEQPYVPFVWEEGGSIRLSVSGGAFHSVNPKDMKFLKWTEGAFKDWGHCGACANGSVTFIAKVPLWFYAEPNSRYGDFTTETYRKFYLNKRDESESGNLYQGYYQTPGYKDEPVCAFVADFQKDDMNGSAICDLLLYENFSPEKMNGFVMDAIHG